MLTNTQWGKNVLPFLAPPIPTKPGMPESENPDPFVTQPSPLLETVKPAAYSEKDYPWLADVLKLLIDIGNRDESLSFRIVLRRDYKQLSRLLEEFVFTVGENVDHPATSVMMLVGFLVERYETENLSKLSEPVEEDPLEWNNESEILYTRGLTSEEMRELEKDHSPAAILEWSETEVAVHAFLSIGNILSESSWIREAISAYDTALRLKSDDAEAYYNRGTAKTLICEYNSAITDFDEAIRLKPQFVEAYYNRGLTNFALNQNEAAETDLQIALEVAEQQRYEDIKANIAKWFQDSTHAAP